MQHQPHICQSFQFQRLRPLGPLMKVLPSIFRKIQAKPEVLIARTLSLSLSLFTLFVPVSLNHDSLTSQSGQTETRSLFTFASPQSSRKKNAKKTRRNPRTESQQANLV